MDRRQFLVTSTLAGGAFALGFALPAARLRADAAAPFAPNAWIRIDADDSVTLVCHRNEMGQDVHTTLAMLLAEELEVPLERVRVEQAPVAPVYINALLGGQITGGSTSVRDAWIPLRQAGAAARTMLVAAAAARWQVDAATLRAEHGEVVNGSKRVRYGELAAAAAALPAPAPDSLVLKQPAAFKLIGSRQPRLDTPAKVKGARLYGMDAKQPGMLYAVLVQCPVIGGTIKSHRVKAKAIDGVKSIVDIGDGVAIVADHYWTAHKARELLEIEWDYGAGAAVSTESVAAKLREGAALPGVSVKANGDAAAALAGAKRKLEADYELPLLAHVALEPMNCLALVKDGACDIWTSTQFPQGAQGVAAARAGLEPAQVRIHAQFIGGGFGRRLEVDFIGQAAAIAKALPGTPVKLVWNREDDTTHDFYRPASLHRMAAALDADGKLVALSQKMVSQSVTERAFPGVVKDGNDPFMTEGAANLTYAVPNLDLRTVIQDTGVRVGYWRSVSNALNAFAIESFVDELAGAAGVDPLAFRLALLDGQPRMKAVLERAAAAAKWAEDPGKDRARGLAMMECYGTYVAAVAEVSRHGEDLHLDKLTYAVDPGIAIHPDQIVAQIESAAITGLMGALRSRITLKDGRVQETNFHQFAPLRINEVPAIEVVLMPSGDAPGGMGEVGTPVAAPAVANAVARLTGTRVRQLPFAAAGVRFV